MVPAAVGKPSDEKRRLAKRWLLGLFCVTWAISCLDPPYPQELVLQHIPTVLAIGALIAVEHRQPLSLTSYAAMVAFLCLHLLGARYLYSNVPYDDWGRAWFGLDPSASLGWRRNHYDRLVHFCYGLLLVGVIRDFLQVFLALSRIPSHVVAVETILASSAVYELVEWFVALTLAPAAAEAYNGQQGDMWDAQKDMALALAGALVGTLIAMCYEHRESRPKP
jgi:putative membrane protein